MKLKNIGIIISREYMTRVRKKSFLLITFGVPVFIMLIYAVMFLIMFASKDKCKQVEVLDESGFVMSYLKDNKIATYKDCSGMSLDELKAGLPESDADLVLYISALNPDTKSVSVEMYAEKPVGVEVKEDVEAKVEDAVEDWRIASYGINDLKQIMEDVRADIAVSTYIIGEDGDKINSSEVYMIVSGVLAMIIYLFVVMFSGMVMSSVIEEKTSRVVEVLVSSVKSIELMFGKIIGVACVALTQFVLWIVLIAVLVGVTGQFVDVGSLLGGDEVAQMTQMAGGMGVDDTAALMQMAADGGENSELQAVFATLKDLNYGSILAAFFVYFLLGYLLYASMFAAIGSAVENEGDSNQLQMPVTIPLLIGFFIAFYTFKAPESQLAFWGSVIPFTSPMVMLARIPFGVPAWEIALSVALLLVTFVAFAYMSARIYRVGILVNGKKSTFKDIWKWLKQK